MEPVNPRTHCNHCRAELTKDEKRGCMVCRVCHPENKDQPVPVPKKTKYLDVKMTEERVREIVRDELENWHIQKPPVTKDETENIAATEVSERHKTITAPTMKDMQNMPEESLSWRQQAKGLGIKLFQRKKADVLAEIKSKMST